MIISDVAEFWTESTSIISDLLCSFSVWIARHISEQFSQGDTNLFQIEGFSQPAETFCFGGYLYSSLFLPLLKYMQNIT